MNILLAPRQLLRLDPGSGVITTVRVLDVNPADDAVWVFDCMSEKRGVPMLIGYSQLMRRLREDDAELARVDPYIVYRGTHPKLDERKQTIWESNWSAINYLVSPDRHAFLFEKHSRGRLLCERVAELPGMDVKRLFTLVRRFWISGMTKEAVQPHYWRCGHHELQPAVRVGRRKGDVGGNPLVPFDGVKAAEAVSFYLTAIGERKRPYMAAQATRVHVYGKEVTVLGVTEKVLSGDLSNVPEERTIISWAEKVEKRGAQKNRAATDKEHNQRMRPLRGKAADAVYGPGSVFEIDASPLNIKVRSRLSGKIALTQPVLYLVVDAYSYVIVGFYVTLHHEKSSGAKLALYNALSDKEEYLASLGLTDKDLMAVGLPRISDCFPPNHACISIKQDRGSAFTAISLHEALSAIEVGAIVLPPLRAEMKGAVENSNFRAQGFLRTKTSDREGFGEASPSHDDDGVYDIFQLERAIALVLMRMNVMTQVKSFPRSYQNTKGTVPCPMDIHVQGLETFKRPPFADAHEVKLNFLQRGKISWSRDCWRLHGFDLRYVFPPGSELNMLRGIDGVNAEYDCVYHPGHMGSVQVVIKGVLGDKAILKGTSLGEDGFSLGEHLLQKELRNENLLSDQNRKAALNSGFAAILNANRVNAIEANGGSRPQVFTGLSSAVKRFERDLPADGARLLGGTDAQAPMPTPAVVLPTQSIQQPVRPTRSGFGDDVQNVFKRVR